MKKSSLLLTAVFAATLALPLAACSGGASEFRVDDYALSLDSERLPAKTLSDKKAVTSVLQLDGAPETVLGNGTFLSLRIRNAEEQTTKYKLFDTATREYVTEAEFDHVKSAGASFTSCGTLRADGSSAITVFSPAGERVLDAYAMNVYSYPTASVQTMYVNGIAAAVYTLQYFTAAGQTQKAVKYFIKNSAGCYEEVSSDRVSSSPVDLYVGAQFNNFGSSVYLGSDKDGSGRTSSLDGWFSLANGTLTETSWEGALFTGTVTYRHESGLVKQNVLTLKNALELGCYGGALYYYEMTLVDPDAKDGYNTVICTDEPNVKYDAALYRYEIAKGKLSRLESDYFFTDMGNTLYNYSLSDFDKVCAKGYPYVNGVAVVSSDTVASRLIADGSANVCLDLTAMPYSLDGNILRLKNNRYYTDGVIFDGEMNPVSVLGKAKIYKNLGLIVAERNNRVLAVDFDGRIVFPPDYASLDFYGGSALTTVYDKNGTPRTQYVVNKDNLKGSVINEWIAAPKNAAVEVHGGLIDVTVESTDESAPFTTTLYNLDGAQIGGEYRTGNPITVAPLNDGYLLNTDGAYWLVY